MKNSATIRSRKREAAAARRQRLPAGNATSPAPAAKAAATALAEQNTDFTAEGSPPPGKVALQAPVGSGSEG